MKKEDFDNTLKQIVIERDNYFLDAFASGLTKIEDIFAPVPYDVWIEPENFLPFYKITNYDIRVKQGIMKYYGIPDDNSFELWLKKENE